MKRFAIDKRLAAAVAALVLAALGVVALLSYADAARDEAFAGAEVVSVLQVTQQVPAGSSAAAVADATETVQLPQAAVPAEALASLDGVQDQVTKTDLAPGEMLLPAKFGTAAKASKAGQVDLPKGLQEVSIALDPVRVVGGVVQPGDKVGVLVSYGLEGQTTGATNYATNGALVLTSSVGASTQQVSDDDSAAPAETIQLKLALSAQDAAKVVHGMEFGKVWLTRQGADAKTARPYTEAEDVVR